MKWIILLLAANVSHAYIVDEAMARLEDAQKQELLMCNKEANSTKSIYCADKVNGRYKRYIKRGTIEYCRQVYFEKNAEELTLLLQKLTKEKHSARTKIEAQKTKVQGEVFVSQIQQEILYVENELLRRKYK